MTRLKLIIGVTVLICVSVMINQLFLQYKQQDIIELYIWHDLGATGDQWFETVGSEFAKEHANVVIKPVNLSTQMWLDKSISALLMENPPDLLFNNYERIFKVEQQTGKLLDLRTITDRLVKSNKLNSALANDFKYSGQTIVIPVQEVQMAFGIRKSWMASVGKSFPESWEETVQLAELFSTADPDKNGKNDTYGFALEANKPRDLIHMLDLFTLGSGVRYTIVDEDGDITIHNDKQLVIAESLYNLMQEGKAVSPQTVYYGFSEMYQVIENNQAGIFRVGDWNVNKWDKVLGADYEIGPWPSFDGNERNVVIGGLRGVAIPEASPNRALAEAFAEFLLEDNAQKSSFQLIGSCLSTNLNQLDLEQLSPHQRFFAEQSFPRIHYDYPEIRIKNYMALENIYHQKFLSGLKRNDRDFKKVIQEIQLEMEDTLDNP